MEFGSPGLGITNLKMEMGFELELGFGQDVGLEMEFCQKVAWEGDLYLPPFLN